MWAKIKSQKNQMIFFVSSQQQNAEKAVSLCLLLKFHLKYFAINATEQQWHMLPVCWLMRKNVAGFGYITLVIHVRSTNAWADIGHLQMNTDPVEAPVLKSALWQQTVLFIAPCNVCIHKRMHSTIIKGDGYAAVKIICPLSYCIHWQRREKWKTEKVNVKSSAGRQQIYEMNIVSRCIHVNDYSYFLSFGFCTAP